MITRDFANGVEGDLRVDGIGVCSQYGSPALVVFNARTGQFLPAVPDPPQIIRWPRLKPTGPIHVAGQGQDFSSFEFAEFGWQTRGAAHGTSPVIYDGANALHIIRPAADQTSQGYRCNDQQGHPMLGDDTLAIATVPNGRVLHNYTPIDTPEGRILVGQDHESGAHVVFQGTRYILDTGNVQFIRAAWSPADGLAVLITHYLEHLVRVFLFTVAEIRSLPVFKDTIDPPLVAPPAFTISSPTFPPEGISGTVPFALRCVYANEPGGGPLDWIDWLLGSSATGPWSVNAHNPGDDFDHTYTFGVGTAGTTAYIKARGGNAAGTHETGVTRKVNLQETTPVPPPHGQQWRLRTVHGGFLEVGPDSFLREGPTGDLFEIVDASKPGFIGLKVRGAYVAAEPDWRLKADRGSIGDWEYFTRTVLVEADESERWQFFSDAQRRYISAHDDGSVLCDQTHALSWETFTPEVPTHGEPISRLHVDGPIFRATDNLPWRLKGVTAFKLARLFADGADIRPFLEYFRELGANTLRVWPYVPWPEIGWVAPSNDAIIQFVRFVRSEGFYTYLTLLTSDEDIYIPWAKSLVQALTVADLDSLLLEAGNEPRIHKSINVRALQGVLEASPYIYTSGEYDDSALWFGRKLDAHPERDPEWVRRCHDLLEYFYGGGPHYQAEPAVKVVCIAGEPIRADLANFNENDALAGFAGFALLGGGAVVHYENGKFGRLPDVAETGFVEAAFEGLQAFPADVWFAGPYERIDEHGETLRTYRRGDYAVRMRPTSGPILLRPGATMREREALDAREMMHEEFHTQLPLTDAQEERLVHLLRTAGVPGRIRMGPITLDDPSHWFVECHEPAQATGVVRHAINDLEK
jgi:hypothetical protein